MTQQKRTGCELPERWQHVANLALEKAHGDPVQAAEILRNAINDVDVLNLAKKFLAETKYVNRPSSAAVLSDDGTYRYRLTRAVGEPMRDGTCLFVMLNPSTADAEHDDPTIRRCMNFANGWGYDTLEVVNLFAFRATSPNDMKRSVDPVGPENDRHILEAAREAAIIVAAWGQHGSFRGRSGVVRQMFINEGIPLYALKRGRDGQPAHPLYLPASLEPARMD